MSTAGLVDRLASRAGSVGRRGFLTRAALAGSAVAAHPVSFLFERGSAYAAVCNCHGSDCDCGASCCDGYSELCCTLTGANACPAGTIAAGWWKAETSPHLCGGPRYYIDCNAGCGDCGCGPAGMCSGECAGVGCGCANGDCDNRVSGCNLFRYGQCNSGVPCVGPIVCRVVTCEPPWTFDPACSPETRVDEETAHHDRPCIHALHGHIDGISVVGEVTHVFGWAAALDTRAPVAVSAWIDRVPVGAATASLARPDVPWGFPGLGPDHGYDVAVRHPGPAHTICLLGTGGGDGAGFAYLGCVSVPELPGSPLGGLDIVEARPSAVRVVGWVIDPDAPAAAAVHVYVDGVFAGGGSATARRPDVAAAFPRFGPRRGFDLAVPAAPGSRVVRVYGIDRGVGYNRLIGERTVIVPGRRR